MLSYVLPLVLFLQPLRHAIFEHVPGGFGDWSRFLPSEASERDGRVSAWRHPSLICYVRDKIRNDMVDPPRHDNRVAALNRSSRTRHMEPELDFRLPLPDRVPKMGMTSVLCMPISKCCPLQCARISPRTVVVDAMNWPDIRKLRQLPLNSNTMVSLMSSDRRAAPATRRPSTGSCPVACAAGAGTRRSPPRHYRPYPRL